MIYADSVTTFSENLGTMKRSTDIKC